jgi:hypothetical protein
MDPHKYPVLIDDVMRTLLDRPADELGAPKNLATAIKGFALDPLTLLDAMTAAQQRGLIKMGDLQIPLAVLTDAGRNYKADDLAPETYIFKVDETLTVGTLANWASCWEYYYYAREARPSDRLKTWDNSYGYAVHIYNLGADDNDLIRYQIWAAGEQAFVTIDDRA